MQAAFVESSCTSCGRICKTWEKSAVIRWKGFTLNTRRWCGKEDCDLWLFEFFKKKIELCVGHNRNPIWNSEENSIRGELKNKNNQKKITLLNRKIEHFSRETYNSSSGSLEVMPLWNAIELCESIVPLDCTTCSIRRSAQQASSRLCKIIERQRD